jgi:hypothetical protein
MKVPSNRPFIFVQNLTTTQPEEIGGKHGQEPQHNLRGIAPLVHNGAYSCSEKKNKKTKKQTTSV